MELLKILIVVFVVDNCLSFLTERSNGFTTAFKDTDPAGLEILSEHLYCNLDC